MTPPLNVPAGIALLEAEDAAGKCVGDPLDGTCPRCEAGMALHRWGGTNARSLLERAKECEALEREREEALDQLKMALGWLDETRAERDRLRADVEQRNAAIAWALGYTTFPERQPGQGAYWWRTELRQRSGITDADIANTVESPEAEGAR